MRFQKILSAVYHAPWNITHSGWLAIHELVQSKLLNAQFVNGMGDFVNPRPDYELDENGIAHIHITGTLGKHLSKIEKSCGNTGYEQIEEELTLAEDQGAVGVLLNVNSPGGSSAGNIETARLIAETTLPVVAFTDDLMASAAYALSAGAQRIVAAPSAQVGSIGTILPLIDESAAWDKLGVKPAYITHTGGDLKDAFWPPSFSAEHQRHLQELVDDYFSQFRDHVTAHRDVTQPAMRGQTFIGQRARDYNLVDDIGSIEVAYDYLLQLARS